MRAGGKTERHDEANIHFQNIANAPKIQLNKANREKVKKIGKSKKVNQSRYRPGVAQRVPGS